MRGADPRGAMARAKDSDSGDLSGAAKGAGAIQGLMNGFTRLLERLEEVSEQVGAAGEGSGEGVERTFSGTFEPGRMGPPGLGGPKGLKGVYGVSLKVGLGDEGLKVEPFGNLRRDEATGEAVVDEVREPLVDV